MKRGFPLLTSVEWDVDRKSFKNRELVASGHPGSNPVGVPRKGGVCTWFRAPPGARSGRTLPGPGLCVTTMAGSAAPHPSGFRPGPWKWHKNLIVGALVGPGALHRNRTVLEERGEPVEIFADLGNICCLLAWIRLQGIRSGDESHINEYPI